MELSNHSYSNTRYDHKAIRMWIVVKLDVVFILLACLSINGNVGFGSKTVYSKIVNSILVILILF